MAAKTSHAVFALLMLAKPVATIATDAVLPQVVTYANGPEALHTDFTYLVGRSALVVTGTLKPPQTQIDERLRLVRSNFPLVIDEVLKGNVTSGTIVTLSMIGGTATLADGTTTETRVRNNGPLLQLPVSGQTYLLFLGKTGPTATDARQVHTYGLMEGSWGIHELSSDGVVKPLGPPRGLTDHVRGRPIKDVLGEVREVIKKGRQ